MATTTWIRLSAALGSAVLAPQLAQAAAPSDVYDVRNFGAKADGQTIDSDAINRAIAAAHGAGGGSVVFTAGTYATYSVHLMSNVTLVLGQGATLLAAEPSGDGKTGYDYPEPNAFDPYEDFGHSHWHNSLIWGENLENVGIIGPGRIYGRGLSRGHGHSVRDQTPEEHAAGVRLPDAANAPKDGSIVSGPFTYPSAKDTMADGVGNKAIALKNCRNVLLRDFTIYHGGHFGILATGTDNMTIDNLRIDTNRDGMDVDCCVNVHISNCTVNSPWDDGICLKSCFALGMKRACEDITITNCHVSGFLEGTMLDGTRRKDYAGRENSGPTGRIKFGTESNGGYKNIVVSNCTFDYCRGLALEIVDGGSLEDVSISNLTMRDIVNSAIYVRLGERNREAKTETGHVRRVNISNVVAYNVDPRFSSIIEGSPGHPIEDLSLSDIRIAYRGGGTKEQAAIEPPENPQAYPEPQNHGIMPAYGFFVRHVTGLDMHDLHLGYLSDDQRPAFVLEDVTGAEFRSVKAEHAAGTPVFDLRQVRGFSARDVRDVPDTSRDLSEKESL
jgi:polygalacturonase